MPKTNGRLGGNILHETRDEDIRTALLDFAPTLIYCLDNSLCYQYVNKRYEQWLGMGKKDLVGKSVEEALGTEALNALKPNMTKALAGQTVEFDSEVPYKIGTRYVHVLYVPNINSSGSIEGIMVFINDLTEKKTIQLELERKAKELQDYFDNATVGLHWVDANGIIIWANRAELQLLGYKAEEYIGHHIAEFHAERKVIDDILTRLSRNETLNQYESVLKCKDGSLRNVMINSNVLWEGENFVHTRCFTLDITEKRRAEQLLSKVNSDLERKVKERTSQLSKKNEELEQFAYAASHDLQEPLRKISIFSDRLKTKGFNNTDIEAAGYVEKINDAANRMNNLIKDLLSFAKLSQPEEQIEEVDLKELIENVKADLELMIIQKKANVVSNNLPVVCGIPVQLQQLFYNLLNNALKFAKKDTLPIITVSGRNIDESERKEHDLDRSKKYFEITVTDNGIGFDQSQADEVFTIFRRLHDRSYTGTGIGLAICKKVVDNHDGRIWVDATPNIGTIFTIILPDNRPASC